MLFLAILRTNGRCTEITGDGERCFVESDGVLYGGIADGEGSRVHLVPVGVPNARDPSGDRLQPSVALKARKRFSVIPEVHKGAETRWEGDRPRTRTVRCTVMDPQGIGRAERVGTSPAQFFNSKIQNPIQNPKSETCRAHARPRVRAFRGAAGTERGGGGGVPGVARRRRWARPSVIVADPASK